MSKRNSLIVAAVAVITFSLIGCAGGTGGTGGGAGGGAGGGSADPDLTCAASPPATAFSKVWTDVFPDCTVCHQANSVDSSGSYGLYDTEANAYLQVGKKSLYALSTTLKVVDPNHLENSSMWLKVLGHAKSPAGNNIGSRMPNGGPALSAAKQQLLKDWICSGAKM